MFISKIVLSALVRGLATFAFVHALATGQEAWGPAGAGHLAPPAAVTVVDRPCHAVYVVTGSEVARC